MSASRSSKCSRLRISAHKKNLSTQLKNLAPKTWISQREVGESSRGCQKVMKTVRNQQSPRVGVECLLKRIWKTSCWGCQTQPVRPVHHTGRVTRSGLRAFSKGNSLSWQIWLRTQTYPLELKFQWSYCLSDKSSPISDMSGKRLWKPVKGPDKSGRPDLLLDRSNRSDRYDRFQHTLGIWLPYITHGVYLGFEHFGFVKITMLHRSL
jgi:hypothetical protein